MDLDKAESTDARLDNIARARAGWVAIVHQWDDLMPMDPVPLFTREHAEKMIRKLDEEGTGREA